MVSEYRSRSFVNFEVKRRVTIRMVGDNRLRSPFRYIVISAVYLRVEYPFRYIVISAVYLRVEYPFRYIVISAVYLRVEYPFRYTAVRVLIDC